MCRAARTLLYYLMETNLNYHHWLLAYIRTYPIPQVSAFHMQAASNRSRIIATVDQRFPIGTCAGRRLG